MRKQEVQPVFRRPIRRARSSPTANKTCNMPVFEDIDLEIAKLADIVPSELLPRADSAKLREILPHERGGRQHVNLGRPPAVQPEIMRMTGERRLHFRPSHLGQQPSPRRFIDVVVIAFLVRRAQIGWIMHEQEHATAGRRVQLLFNPVSLLGFTRQA